jgi:predicted DCC family thiol-disulfide oxidoreductase YuxK
MTGAFGWTGGQYALFRVLLGAYLCAHFIGLMPWTTELFSSAGLLPDASASPAFAVPNLLWLSDAPAALHALVMSAAIAAVLLAMGRHDRIAAAWIWLVLMALLARNPLIANPGMPYVGWMLLAHLFMASWPRQDDRGAHDARAQSGHSPMAPAVIAASWVVLALSYSYSGYTKLFSATWLSGDAVAVVLDNPLARDTWLREVFTALPATLLKLLTWFILWVELLYAPLFLVRRLRVWLWSSMLFVQVGFLLLLKFPDLTTPMLLMHLLACEPRWFDRRRVQPVTLYYDGHCALCHRIVRFALAEDRHACIRFAALQGPAAQAARIIATQRDGDTFVIETLDGKIRVRSDALIELLGTLGGLWRIPAVLLRCIPRRLRDAGYALVGQYRLRLFGRTETLCPLVPEALRARFLPGQSQDVR